MSPITLFEVAREGVRTDAAAVVGADLLDDRRLRIVEGDREAALTAIDDGPATIVPRSLAERDGLAVGSDVVLAIGGERVVRFEVVGIADHTLPGRVGEAILVGWDSATSELGVLGAEVFAIRYEPGLAAAARPELEAAATLAALETNPLDRVAGAVDAALGRVFGLFDALAIVAVLVAGLGIVNTLTMNVLERVRELGVLRAAGMTTRQMRRTVVVEAGILGIIGTILGVVAGLAAGALVGILSGSGVALASGLPWGAIGLAALLGIGLSMLAAWYPARLASRLAIVHAVRHE